jgi:hypothetical protein
MTLLDLVVVGALVALLLWLVRLDQRPRSEPTEPVRAVAHLPG